MKIIRRIRTLVTLGVVSLAAAAFLRELRRSPEARSWQGRIAGVPYDFRPPTRERLIGSVWQPESYELLLPHGFGVGWSVNLAQLQRLGRYLRDTVEAPY